MFFIIIFLLHNHSRQRKLRSSKQYDSIKTANIDLFANNPSQSYIILPHINGRTFKSRTQFLKRLRWNMYRANKLYIICSFMQSNLLEWL